MKERYHLTIEQLTDPDFRLKQLEKLSKGKFQITCSKCHHCRGRPWPPPAEEED